MRERLRHLDYKILVIGFLILWVFQFYLALFSFVFLGVILAALQGGLTAANLGNYFTGNANTTWFYAASLVAFAINVIGGYVVGKNALRDPMAHIYVLLAAITPLSVMSSLTGVYPLWTTVGFNIVSPLTIVLGGMLGVKARPNAGLLS